MQVSLTIRNIAIGTGVQEFQTPFFMIWQCIARPPKAQVRENFSLSTDLRSWIKQFGVKSTFIA
jgi:hypothetical protein